VFTNLFVIGDAGENVDGFRPGQRDQAATVMSPAEPLVAAALVTRAEPALRTAAFSPRARRFAKLHDFHPAEAEGSGPGGRILEIDLRRLHEVRTSTAPVLQPAAKPASRLRDRIARRMRESLASTAQYTLHSSADATGLLTLRARLKRSAHLPDITINDLVTFCTIEALLDVPSLNAEYVDGAIREHADVHIGFACDTPRGLLVPVVRDAHTLAIDELAVRMKELAAQAAAGSIAPDNLSGATFTISNLGGLGIESFTPILNPPQVAILGVGAIHLKPARRNGQVEFVDTIGLSLTCDHQVIDGAPGARFLQVLKSRIESVETLCAI
jgi:pyruvate dehydrogenase E2 component (dihydrolipoamide acetyltransferase)